MQRLLPRLALLCFLGFAALPGLARAETRLDIDTSRLLVVRLLVDGEYRAAHAVTSALLQRPNAPLSDHLLHARALRGVGQHQAAGDLAKDVFNRAQSPKLRYDAAMVVAQALSSDRRKTMAQLWLRRAAEIAPDEHRKARAVRIFRYVRATNPWSVQARFGISPSSNINRGPTDNTFTWNGLTFIDPALVPLRGYEISSGFNLTRRVPLSPDTRLRFSLIADDSRFVLSPSAKAKVPTARASDYAFSALETQATLDWSTPESPWSHENSLALGRNWSGGEHLTDYVRIGMASYRSLNERNHIGLNFSAERQWRQDLALRSADVISVGGRWGHALSSGARLVLDLGFSDMDSDSADIAHQKARVGLTYAPGQPVLGALASLSVGLESRWYDRPLYAPEPREDTRLSIGGSLFFTEFDLFGFAPKVGLTATRTNSNVSRFETEALEFNLGLQSVF